MAQRRAKVESARLVFARNLRAARVALQLSQEELSFRTGLHRTYVGSVERGERNVSIDNMERLAKGVEARLADLLNS